MSTKLEKQLAQAKERQLKVERERNKRKADLTELKIKPLEQQLRDARTEVETTLRDEFNDRVGQVNNEVWRLEREVEQERISAKSGHPLIGKRYRHWKPRRYGGGALLPTDEIGEVTVFNGSNYTVKSGWAARPAVGSLFLLNVKKDGKLGVTSYGLVDDDGKPPLGWYPVGVNPNDKPEAV